MLKAISEILLWITIMVVFFSLGALFYGQWMYFVIGLITSPVLFWILLRTEGKIIEQIMEMDLLVSKVENINKDSFDIINSKSRTKYKWNRIRQITLTEEKDLKVTHKIGGGFRVNKNYRNFYKLLQNIPSELQNNNEIKSYINQILETVIPCPVCGKIAFNKTECLSCGFEQFTNELLGEFENESAYIKQQQLDCFATIEPNEKVIFFDSENDGFSFDKNWKPFFTKAEIIQYSKENHW